MMKKKWIGCLTALVLCAAFSLSACGPSGGYGDDDLNVDITKPVTAALKIYAATDDVKGSNDDLVRSAIEEKLKADTKMDLELEVRMTPTSDFNNTVTLALSRQSQVDAVVNHNVDGNGIRNFIDNKDSFRPLNALIDKYAPKLKAAVPQQAWDAVTDEEGDIMAIPSVVYSRQFAIMYRQDWLDEAKLGFSKPETIPQFTQMLTAFKSRDEGVIPMMAYPWDVERVLLPGAYDTVSYTEYAERGGKLLPGQIDDNYQKVLQQEYEWVRDGLWDSNNINRPESTRLQYFVSGLSGVYIVYPEIVNLIKVSRQLKTVDPAARVNIVGPLTDGEHQSKGFQETKTGFSALAVPRSSKNYVCVLRYLNWLCERENYELAVYGREGQEWVRDGEKRGFPAGKEAEYIVSPPYSSIYKLLYNVQTSDRLLNSYTEEELGYIALTREAPTYPSVALNVWIPRPSDMLSDVLKDANDDFYRECRLKAWNGTGAPSATFAPAVSAFHATAKEYLVWLNNEWNLLKNK